LLPRKEAEDVLKLVYTLETRASPVSVAELARAMRLAEPMIREEITSLGAIKWVEQISGDSLRLTDEGRCRARELVRAHRLWERYLVDREGMALDAVHAEAHRREHDMTLEEIESLDAALEHPAWDPHGHVIPAPDGHLPVLSARSLLDEGMPGARLRIIQLDDDPPELLAQLVALGLEPGVELEVKEREATCLRAQVNGDLIPLANAAAQGIFVVPAPALPVPLGELPVGSRARIVEVQGSGKHQRRMLDMGFVPGAEIVVIREAPLGDPIEYRVKETSVALRKEDANTILVEEFGNV
jgi:Fe2+ transport system protein FeoA